MQPSNVPGEVMILEGKPECSIVYDAYFDPNHIVQRPATEEDLSIEQLKQSLGFRLDQETHHASFPYPGSVIADVDVDWNREPTFHVLDRDAAFVLAAAQRILESPDPKKNLFLRLFERGDYEARLAAAKTIADFLTPLVTEKPSGAA